jgi:chorismate lyase/3-hydroxybenzoate synthase
MTAPRPFPPSILPPPILPPPVLPSPGHPGPGFRLGGSEFVVPVDCLAGPGSDTVLSAWRGTASVLGGDERLPLKEATQRLYQGILEQTAGAFLYRIWNYVPAINGTTADLEHYRHFCQGRSLAFEERYGRGFEERMPAASAVGCRGSRLLVAFLAGKTPAQYLENPRQVPAYRYPASYGPRAPSFARATAVRADGRGDVFIAGTSAIVGHATMAPSQTAAQLDCTLENLRAISQVCGLGEDLAGRQAETRHFKVYLRHASDLAEVTSILDDRLLRPTDQVSYLRADICRADLNIEIEATVLGARLD